MSRMLKLAAAVSVVALFPATLATASAENLKVIASFSIIADFAKNVGGDRVDITTLVGPNGDAHVYEPKPADAAAAAASDVVLVNGLQFEGFLQRLVEASGTKAPIVELTKGGEVLKNAEEEHQHQARCSRRTASIFVPVFLFVLLHQAPISDLRSKIQLLVHADGAALAN